MSPSIASSSTKSTIINFAAAGAPRARNAKLPDHPDAELIQACLNYAVAMRGASGAYEADPTGDNDFAQAADTRLLKQAAKDRTSLQQAMPQRWMVFALRLLLQISLPIWTEIARPHFCARSRWT